MKKEIIEYRTLPTKLIDSINKNILFSGKYRDYRTKNNLVKCVSSIYYHQIHVYHNREAYAALGSDYWKKVFDGDYTRYLNPLQELGIIEMFDYGQKYVPYDSEEVVKLGEVRFRYRVNPDLLNIEHDRISFLKKGQSAPDKKIKFEPQDFFPKRYFERYFQIQIKEDDARLWISSNVEDICMGYLKVDYVDALPSNLVIRIQEFLETGSYDKPFYLTVAAAKQRAIDTGKTLFYFKKGYYMADVDSFLSFRKEGIIYNYNIAISKLSKLPLLSNRSDKTLRLQNMLVNFPSDLLQFVRLNGQHLVQIDLRTSQFLLFANMLNAYINGRRTELFGVFKHDRTIKYLKRFYKVLDLYRTVLPSTGVEINDSLSLQGSSSNVVSFIRDVFFSDFYERVRIMLDLPEREVAKLSLFQLIFRRTDRPNVLIDRLREYYPTVMEIIAEFKTIIDKDQTSKIQELDESNFSVFLQCIEAEIYIDKILIPLQTKGIPCFSRHDSIIIPAGNVDEVQDFIAQVFNDLGFRYNSKTEEHLSIETYLELQEFSLHEEEIDPEIYFEEEPFDDSDEEDTIPSHITEKLFEIGICEDYAQDIDSELLEEMAFLPVLNHEQCNYLLDDVENMRMGMSFFQEQTNKIISELIIKEIYKS